MKLNDHLLTQARELALIHELAPTRHRCHHFWRRFRTDQVRLRSFVGKLTMARADCSQLAEDWLLDHIAFLELQAKEVHRHLSRDVLNRLPCLQDSETPRVYAMCDEYLQHVNGRYDVDTFEDYLNAYQEVSVLSIAECWALPSILRVVLLHRLTEAMGEVRRRHEVCEWVASLLGRLDARPRSQSGQIQRMLDQMVDQRPLSSVETVHLIRHLSEREPDFQAVGQWVRGYVANTAQDLEQMASWEHQLESDLQVTCGDLITSLHTLERQPWQQTFERISEVDRILAEDTFSGYQRLDFASREQLRRMVAGVARRLGLPEAVVARATVDLAKVNREKARDRQAAHPAYYLLDANGLMVLTRALAKSARLRRQFTFTLALAVRRYPFAVYIGTLGILFFTFLLLGATLVTEGIPVGVWSRWVVVAMLLVPASEWAVSAAHSLLADLYPRRILLRYDFSEGIPLDARTLVVLPIIWSTLEDVDDAVDRLRVHFLANRQRHLHFALLGDFHDAPAATTANDADLVRHAIQRVDELRAQYGSDRFFLFHRDRRFNPNDGVYMGWERKRGKLVEFTELLLGSHNTSYSTVHGDTAILPEVRYLFTADHDTQLPIGVVSRLVATLHFPYNQPRLNPSQTRVIEGFGVLQPRVAVSYQSAHLSRFAALWAGEPGIDPYAFAMSNPYQAVFEQAIFVGKGLFDVHVFAKLLARRIPENLVLSHDLLEGGFLRAGLTPDIELVEDHPTTFYAYQLRAERWMRGDWQLLPWLAGRTKDRSGQRQPVDLGLLTRLQILDNLRRSVLMPALYLVALLGVAVLPGHRGVWLVIVVLTLFLPFWQSLDQNPRYARHRRRMATAWGQSIVGVATLPFTAVATVPAIVRALYRLLVSKRKLLEWTPIHQVNRKALYHRILLNEPAGYAATLLFLAVGWRLPGGERVGATVLATSWLLAHPLIARLDRPVKPVAKRWADRARPELRAWARQIWSFFDHYVTAEESWLPPDNVQFDPDKVAHRTSPTNIGLYLTAVLAAADLGFIDGCSLVARLASTLTTLAGLEKWHGHLFNWYDTRSAEPLYPRYVSTVDSGNLIAYLLVVRRGLEEWIEKDPDLGELGTGVVHQIDRLLAEVDFLPLYNSDQRLFSVGFDVEGQRKETALYDLLASEARQTSFVAIALGQIPVAHWFTLGRSMTVAAGWKTLLSWSGTMFEYLMPGLIMRTYRKTVWDSTYQGALARQREHARKRRVPLGASESGYYAFDYAFNYQYHAFGVPALALDRTPERETVVAPYAAALALSVAGRESLQALAAFKSLQAKGVYGFFEAVDFTRRRLPPGAGHKVVQSYMAHHQGMMLLAVGNVLLDNLFVERFHADFHVRAADLLLQERVPDAPAIIAVPLPRHAKLPEMDDYATSGGARRIVGPEGGPQVTVLSNGTMTEVIADDGSGMLSWRGLAVTRGHTDPVIPAAGLVFYVHDLTSAATWSPTRFPCLPAQATWETVLYIDKARFHGSFQDIDWRLEVTVHPEADVEIRRFRLTNRSAEDRVLEVTSFMELVLGDPEADRAHPAFSKLFVETGLDADHQCLFAHRRPRSASESELWAAHVLYVDGERSPAYEFETDRGRFIGRGCGWSLPHSIDAHLEGSTGAVVDPAFAMRRTLHLAPGESAMLYGLTAAAPSKSDALAALQQLSQPAQVDRGFHLAWVRAQVDLRHLHMSLKDAVLAHQWAACVLYEGPLSRPRREAILHNTLGPAGLWAHGLSTAAPLTVIDLKHRADTQALTRLIRQHQYLVSLGLAVQLVILDEVADDAAGDLVEWLTNALAAAGVPSPSRITVLKAHQLSVGERILLRASASLWLRSNGPSLAAVLGHRTKPGLLAPRFRTAPLPPGQPSPVADRGEFFNGFGGFIDHGQAYHLEVAPAAGLPRPWSNVIANPEFGCLVTELGTGYTWWRNSHQYKLSPWSNDPVVDPPGECLYLTDRETGRVWTATPMPAGSRCRFEVTHGWGFSRFASSAAESAVAHTMEISVPPSDAVKVIRLQLTNTTSQPKSIAVTYYCAWVLGEAGRHSAPFVVTDWDMATRTLTARNRRPTAFGDAVAFLHIAAPSESAAPIDYSWTGDRMEFIGREGTLSHPAALDRERLSGSVGAFSSACGAIQAVVAIPAGASVSLVVLLGAADSPAGVRDLVGRYGSLEAQQTALAQVTDFWQSLVTQIHVTTPDRATDVMLNGWLLYQVLSCRIWARTAFYQAGGAFGFRDQLQDSLALLHAAPSLTRQQIVLHAAHQYTQGDVQHWWHDDLKKGLRTHIADDPLWLAYAVSRYVEHTADEHLLTVQVPYLESAPLAAEETERYEDIRFGEERGSILDHCLRAIRHACRFGEHGLPLIGTGDWNDGLNRVGPGGRGESVWLGWFLLDVLKRFARLKGPLPPQEATRFAELAGELETNLNAYAWDGGWFRRAFTDGGRWLGSRAQPECRIDAVAQSWSVIADGAPLDRQLRAMRAFDRELVDGRTGLARLLAEPFDETKPSPGYIQGYPPGIRENGGQYTHGAVWSVIAWAMLGRGHAAFRLFSLLNPVNHTRSAEDVFGYGNEPYVTSADVYAAPGHEGQGGWSWYTGSAGWLYQAGIEYVLGLSLSGRRLFVQPAVPSTWKSFAISYRYGTATYHITVQSRPGEVDAWILDEAAPTFAPFLELVDDGQTHTVVRRLSSLTRGRRPTAGEES